MPCFPASATGAGLHFGRGGHHCHKGWQRWTQHGGSPSQHGTMGLNQKWSFMTWIMKGVYPHHNGTYGEVLHLWHFLGVNGKDIIGFLRNHHPWRLQVGAGAAAPPVFLPPGASAADFAPKVGEWGFGGEWQVVSNTCLYYEYNRLKHHFLVAKLCYTLVFQGSS